jgi:hypothetical protein
MVRLTSSALFFALVACSSADLDSTGTGGGQGNVGEGSTVKTEDASESTRNPPLATGGGDAVDCGDVATDLTILPDPIGFLAGGQYVVDVLAAGVAPDAAALQVEDLEPYFLSLAASASPSLSAHVSPSGGHVLEAFAPAAAGAGGAVELVVLVDVSPSNSPTVALRDALLDSLAAGLDVGSTLSIVAFANEAQVILEGAPAESASAEVARTRSFLAPKEGHDLARALKTASAVAAPAGAPARHYFVLTDAGFVPDEASLELARSLADAGSAVSIAQLARSASETGVAPALRSDTLRDVAAAGRGVALFLTSATQLETEQARWFAPRDEARGLSFELPAGLDADLKAIPELTEADSSAMGELLPRQDNPNLSHRAFLPVLASCGSFAGGTIVLEGETFDLTWTAQSELLVVGDALPQARARLAELLAALRKSPTARCAALTDFASAVPECEAGTRACVYQEAAFDLLVAESLAQLCSGGGEAP